MKFTGLLVLMLICISCSKKTNDFRTRVAIQPIGKYDQELVDSIASKVRTFYGVEVAINEPIEMPKAFYTTVRSPRYRADSIIRYLRREKQDSLDYVMGITSYDISTTKKDAKGNIKEPVSTYKDWGIFGLGFCPGPSSIVSSHRMGAKHDLRVERAQKVALHELGHNMGLPHCPNKSCFMQDAAETIKTIDKVDFNLCEDCRKRL